MRPKKKPTVLLIEGPAQTENIILALENLEINNKSLQTAIKANNHKLHLIRKLLGDI